jgi:hypothetical protein
MPVARETIASALYALVNAAVGSVVTLVTSSRRLRHYSTMQASQMPALFQTQRPEEYERTFARTIGLPPKRTMHFEFWLYTSDPQTPQAVPATQLNNVVDAVEAALSPSPVTNTLTLGGIVVSARIDGMIEYGENLTSDGVSAVVIPIAIIIP